MTSNDSPPNDIAMEKASNIKKVSLFAAVAVVVANMVGTGVFGSLGFQLIDIPSGFPIMLLWFIGGVLAFCGAVCYAELGAMLSRSGGEYHLLSEIYHPAMGFLAGWISATVGFAAPIALNATLMGTYVGSIFDISSYWISIPVVLIITAIHLGNLSNIARFQIAFTAIKIGMIVALALAAFAIGTAQPISFLPAAGDTDLILSAPFATSLVYVLYAYTGWNAATYIVGEIDNPKRNFPLALLIGTGFVMIIYLLLNASFLYATPIDDMKGVPEVGLVAAQSVFGNKGGMIMGLLISFGLISTISSMTWAGPRVGATIGEDYSLFAFLKRTNRNGVPVWAILVQTLIVIILILSTSFEKLLNYIQAILTLSSLMVVIGIFVMRFKAPKAERPYRAWGYPITPIVFAAFSIYILYFQIKGEPTAFLIGLATVAVGFVTYLLAKNKR
ncbi:MAG: amino acid permease [Verrucomicrobiota bacterium]